MVITTDKSQAQQAQTQQNQQQSQQQTQATTAPTEQQQSRSGYVDPLGRPIYQGTPRFTDQQAGGDLTGREMDTRDDNYVDSGAIGQHARDVSAHAGALPKVTSDLMRSSAVVPTPPQAPPATPIEPDGTEDPGANADDGLAPRNKDGGASEQH